MGSVRDLFSSLCKGDLLYHLGGEVEGTLEQNFGRRLTLIYQVSVCIDSARIDFPPYIVRALNNFCVQSNANGDCLLCLDFKTAERHPYVPFLRTALKGEAEKAGSSLLILTGRYNEDVWCGTPEEISRFLDRIARPDIQNAIMTEANKQYRNGNPGLSPPPVELK